MICVHVYTYRYTYVYSYANTYVLTCAGCLPKICQQTCQIGLPERNTNSELPKWNRKQRCSRIFELLQRKQSGSRLCGVSPFFVIMLCWRANNCYIMLCCNPSTGTVDRCLEEGSLFHPRRGVPDTMERNVTFSICLALGSHICYCRALTKRHPMDEGSGGEAISRRTCH